MVRVRSGDSEGTGFVAFKTGHVLTAFHVVGSTSARPTVRSSDGTDHRAAVLGVDEDADVVLLAVPSLQAPALPLSPEVIVGESVSAVGYAAGLPGEASITRGIVSAKRRAPENGLPFVQTDAPLNPGNSGGPLLNEGGQVVGMNLRRLKGELALYENLGFALASEALVRLGGDLQRGMVKAAPTPSAAAKRIWGPPPLPKVDARKLVLTASDLGSGWTLGSRGVVGFEPENAGAWFDWSGSRSASPSGLTTISPSVVVYDSYISAHDLVTQQKALEGCRLFRGPNVGDTSVAQVCDKHIGVGNYRDVFIDSAVANVVLTIFIAGEPRLEPNDGMPLLQIMAARLANEVVRPSGGPVDKTTQEAVRTAILEYDRLEEQATSQLDGSILRPRATDFIMANKTYDYNEYKKQGIRRQSHLLDAQFKGFRRVDADYVHVDVVEYWASSTTDSSGKTIRDNPRDEVPQTAVLVNDQGRWKLADIRFYQPGRAPF